MKKVKRYASTMLNLTQRKLFPVSGKASGLPAHIQVETTNECNLCCTSCLRDTLYPSGCTMPFKNFRKLYGDVKPVKINVSGIGEPFINKDIFRIIRYAKEGGSTVNCASNFTLVEDKLSEIIDSGIDQIKISIDASTKETFFKIRKKDLFDTLVGNIEKINELKVKKGVSNPQIRLNYALQHDNMNELAGTIDLAGKLGVSAIYIQYLVYLGREERKETLVGDITPERLKDVLAEADRKTRELGIMTNIDMWEREFDFFWNNMQPEESFMPNKNPCYFPWFSSWVDADGTVRPCPIIPWKKGEAHMGNVNDMSFAEIWNNEKYREFRKAHAKGERPNEVCRKCIPPSLTTIFQVGSRLLPG